jgi:ornithine cyclodeaminase/alanine dehydrogenase-like protein (mu-crystallin family)
MDAVYLTAVRTAAAAALATGLLAREGARKVGILGTGSLAWYSVLAHRIHAPELDELVVYSRSAERCAAFADRVQRDTGMSARPAATPAEAASGAHVVITATNSPEPVLLVDHLEPGQFINAIGIRTEVAPDAIALCRVIADGHDEALNDGKFSTAVAADTVRPEDLGPDIGEVLEGLAPGRTTQEEITFFDSSGVAVQDIVCARYAWECAEAADAGTVISFGDDLVLEGA